MAVHEIENESRIRGHIYIKTYEAPLSIEHLLY